MGEYENSAAKAAEKMKASREKSKEDKRIILIKCLIVLILFYVVGYFAGRFTVKKGESMQNLLTDLGTFLKLNICYVSVVVNLVMAFIGFAIYGKAKSLSKMWDGEGDDLIDKIEDKLFYAGAITSVMVILNIMTFGMTLCTMTLGDEYKPQIMYAFITSLISTAFGFIWTSVLQSKTVTLEKELNPEKRGNVFDTGFQKKWFESCDEAEKMAIYKASYDVFNVSTYVYAIGWCVALTAGFVLKTGMLPIVMVSVMWLIQVVVYIASARKYSK